MKAISHGSNSCQYARRCVRRYRRWQRNKAYTRLRAMVPSVAEQQKVSKVTIVEEAVKYIDVLHERFMKRFGDSEDMEHIKQMIVTLMAQKAAEDSTQDQPHYALPVQTPAPKDVLPVDKRAQ
ncbi:uncharacterized protein LOC124148812 isoform X2 [Haliotis rufescens]|nr:uncharacterized protein LOC124148812 isoform X2 [Haliotis rufescens]XP_046376078.1 uncharacterized protein LOC124148812 isoform X2 [Haliotis rufescens]